MGLGKTEVVEKEVLQSLTDIEQLRLDNHQFRRFFLQVFSGGKNSISVHEAIDVV